MTPGASLHALPWPLRGTSCYICLRGKHLTHSTSQPLRTNHTPTNATVSVRTWIWRRSVRGLPIGQLLHRWQCKRIKAALPELPWERQYVGTQGFKPGLVYAQTRYVW